MIRIASGLRHAALADRQEALPLDPADQRREARGKQRAHIEQQHRAADQVQRPQRDQR